MKEHLTRQVHLSHIQKFTFSINKEIHKNHGTGRSRMNSRFAPNVNLYRQVHSNKSTLENGSQKPSDYVSFIFVK